MARARFAKLEEETRERLLRAAAEEFADRGYEGASINRIIQRSGMSKGSVYYYFEDKADLFSTTFRLAVERLLEEAGWPALDEVAAEDFWDALLALSHRSVALARRDDGWIRLARSFHRFESRTPEHESVARMRELAEGWWRRVVARGTELGLVRDDLPPDLLVVMARAADHAGDRWMADRWEELTPDELGRLVSARVDLVRDMLSKEHQGWNR